MLTRISDEKIDALRHEWHSGSPGIERKLYSDLIAMSAQAQLEADQEKVGLLVKEERDRIMRIFASFGKIQLEKPLSGKEFEALFD